MQPRQGQQRHVPGGNIMGSMHVTHRWLAKPDTAPHGLQHRLWLLVNLLLHVVVIPTLHTNSQSNCSLEPGAS